MYLIQIKKMADVAALLMCIGIVVSAAELEIVTESNEQWTGIAVTDDHKTFVNYPRWSSSVTTSVATGCRTVFWKKVKNPGNVRRGASEIMNVQKRIHRWKKHK